MKKKPIAIILSLAILVSLFFALSYNSSAIEDNRTYWIDLAADQYESGSGTQSDPYLIASAAQLSLLVEQAWTDDTLVPDMAETYFTATRGNYYRIIADIDLSGHLWVPIAHFAGHLDGGGHIISNLETATNQRFSGLISIADSADIKNIGLTNVIIEAKDWSGSLVAWINGVLGKTSVTGCFSSGTVSTAIDTIGGLIGWARYADIENCYSTCAVSTLNAYSNAGGLLGDAHSIVNIRNCYASGLVKAPYDTAEYRAGGLVGGYDSSPATVVNCYYNSANPAGRAGADSSGTALPVLSTSNKLDMLDSEYIITLNGAPSSGAWHADTDMINGGLPILDWQSTETPAAAPVLQSAATNPAGTVIVLTFDKDMASPSGMQEKFTYSVNDESGIVIKLASLSESNSKNIILTLTTPVSKSSDVVKVSYKAGSLTAADGGVLASFDDWSVMNNVPASAITGISTETASLPSSGGSCLITIAGTNLLNGITVTVFDDASATTLTGITSGNGTSQTVTLTFPANTNTADMTYTIKARLDGGTSWDTHTATVTVSRPSAPPPAGGGNGVLGTADTIQVITTYSGAAVINTAGVDATGAPGQSSVTATQEVIDALLEAAKDTGGTGRKDTLELEIGLPGGSTGFTVTIPKTDFSKMAEQTDAHFSLTSDAVSVSFDAKAIDAINSAAKGDTIVISASKIENTSLTPAQQALVGNRPVYDFTVTSGGSTITNFGGGLATVRIPYTLSPAENPHCIVVCYLTDEGTLNVVRVHFDAATGTVVFITSHFSRFAIKSVSVSFSDIPSGIWYENAVTFIASREITSGTDSSQFSPNGLLTRGQFIVMLLKAYGIAPETAPTDNFSDAGNTYYTGYIAAAKHLGITAGIGDNKYAPERNISRQEMFTLLYTALQKLDVLSSPDTGKKMSDYTDAAAVETWAADAMSALVKAGVVTGFGDRLNPTGTTSRAEMAQVLFMLLSA